jgi:hypothetical protein
MRNRLQVGADLKVGPYIVATGSGEPAKAGPHRFEWAFRTSP